MTGCNLEASIQTLVNISALIPFSAKKGRIRSYQEAGTLCEKTGLGFINDSVLTARATLSLSAGLRGAGDGGAGAGSRVPLALACGSMHRIQWQTVVKERIRVSERARTIWEGKGGLSIEYSLDVVRAVHSGVESTLRPRAGEYTSNWYVAFPVASIAESNQFYNRILGCPDTKFRSAYYQEYPLCGTFLMAHQIEDYVCPEDAASASPLTRRPRRRRPGAAGSRETLGMAYRRRRFRTR